MRRHSRWRGMRRHSRWRGMRRHSRWRGRRRHSRWRGRRRDPRRDASPRPIQRARATAGVGHWRGLVAAADTGEGAQRLLMTSSSWDAISSEAWRLRTFAANS
jgi:hypothetical protein